MNSLISIVVPIYNGEKLVKKMLDSILNQTYKNIEIILVNDGSTDNTIGVLTENYGCCKNVTIINKENTGVSDTRNKGIEKAKGEYIIFLDADDYLDKNFIEELYMCAKKYDSDVSMCEYYIVTEDGKNEAVNDLESFDDIIFQDTIKKHLIPEMVAGDKKQEAIRGLVWRTLIKRDLITKHELKFNEKISVAEDLLFLMEVYSFSRSISFVKKPLYYYYRYNGSVLTKYHSNNYNKTMFFFETLVKLLKKIGLYEASLEKLIINRFILYTTGMSNAVRGKRKLKEKFREYCSFYNSFFKDKYIRKMTIKDIFGKRKIVYIMLKMRLKVTTFLLFLFKETFK